MKNIVVALTILSLGLMVLTGCQSMYVTSAKVYLQQNDLDNATEQLQLGLKDNPKDAEAHFLLGKIYAQRKMYPEMLTEFDTALSLNKKYASEIESTKNKHFRNLYNNAVEQFNGDKLDKAAESLRTALVIEPNDLEGWALLGKTYIRQKKSDDALAALEKTVSLDPEFKMIDERILLMELYYNNERYEEALNSAQEIMRHDPNNEEAIKVAAFCCNALGQTEKALEYYENILKDQPDNPDLIFNLGLLYESMERYDDAIAQFERAHELNPEDLEAILHHAQLCLEKTGDYLGAIECYKAALKISQDNPSILNNLGVAQIRAGNELDDQSLIDEGTATLKRAEELKTQNP